MVKIATITGYKPFELGIFKQDHQGNSLHKKSDSKD